MHRSLKLLSVTALTATITACGGGDGSSEPATGNVSFGLTDAPAMEFENVTVAFTEIRLKPEDGEWISFPLDGFETVNLLDLQGGTTEPLIMDEEVPAGPYSEVRLLVDTENSFVTLTDEPDIKKSLAVPSGAQSGLKLKGGFVVAADTTTDYTIDFDARKSIVNPQGESLADYLLKPTLRLVNNLEVGSISGDVDYANINSTRMDDAELANCADNYEGSAYIYVGEDVTPTDLNVTREEGTNPLMVIPVTDVDNDGIYSYTAAFLTVGTYTVSYSCQLDDNETDDTIEFEGTQNVTVVAGEDVPADDIPLME